MQVAASRFPLSFSVMLQPFDYNAEEKSKHKFMVQTAFVPEGETSLENIVSQNCMRSFDLKATTLLLVVEEFAGWRADGFEAASAFRDARNE